MSKTIDFEKKVIENIFKIAYEKGYKEQVIADALNLDRTVSSKIKSGAKVLRISMLPDIARALEVERNRYRHARRASICNLPCSGIQEEGAIGYGMSKRRIRRERISSNNLIQ